jgi:hypothetical protein
MARFSVRVVNFANRLSYPILLVPLYPSVLLIWSILMYVVWLPSLRRGAIVMMLYLSMTYFATLGFISWLLVARFSWYISNFLPWFTLSSPRLFMCSRATLLGSMSPRCCAVFLLSRGLLLKCLGAHAHNGMAECKHRHLLETTRVMMIGALL